jgi:hypothetical protein
MMMTSGLIFLPRFIRQQPPRVDCGHIPSQRKAQVKMRDVRARQLALTTVRETELPVPWFLLETRPYIGSKSGDVDSSEC